MKNAEMLLRNVQAKSFLAHDILLYLDTHPDDCQALDAYRAALRDRRSISVRCGIPRSFYGTARGILS